MTKEDQVRQMLSDKYNLPMFVINAIVTTPFRLLKEVMEEQKMECVSFPYFGKFYVTDGMKWKVNEKKAKAALRKAERDSIRVLQSDMEEGSNREVISEEIKDMSGMSTQERQ